MVSCGLKCWFIALNPKWMAGVPSLALVTQMICISASRRSWCIIPRKCHSRRIHHKVYSSIEFHSHNREAYKFQLDLGIFGTLLAFLIAHQAPLSLASPRTCLLCKTDRRRLNFYVVLSDSPRPLYKTHSCGTHSCGRKKQRVVNYVPELAVYRAL